MSTPATSRMILLLALAGFASMASMRVTDAMLPALAETFARPVADVAQNITLFAVAYGLMQLIPGTGRRYARKLGIRRFSTASLTNPETNVRLGTEYFADLVERAREETSMPVVGDWI